MKPDPLTRKSVQVKQQAHGNVSLSPKRRLENFSETFCHKTCGNVGISRKSNRVYRTVFILQMRLLTDAVWGETLRNQARQRN